MLELRNFFVSAPVYDYSDFVPCPSLRLVPEKQADGTTSIELRDLNTYNNPFSLLDASDFSLQRMLDSGVSYKALNINPDLRLGFDDELNAFNAKLESMADELFDVSNVKPSNE